MLKITKILFLALFIISNTASASKVYKCIVNGKTTFKDSPCAKDIDYGLKSIDTFDGWKYGMNILAAKKVAKKRNLPFTPSSIVVHKTYNERTADSMPNARVYRYNSVVAGKNTSVKLFFTQKTRKLYKIQTRFQLVQSSLEEKEYFYKSLVDQLTRKYGRSIEAKDYPSTSNIFTKFIIKDIVGTEKIWGVNKRNIVSLKRQKHSNLSYELKYQYVPLLKQHIAETTLEIRKKTDRALIKDSGRF